MGDLTKVNICPVSVVNKLLLTLLKTFCLSNLDCGGLRLDVKSAVSINGLLTCLLTYCKLWCHSNSTKDMTCDSKNAIVLHAINETSVSKFSMRNEAETQVWGLYRGRLAAHLQHGIIELIVVTPSDEQWRHLAEKFKLCKCVNKCPPDIE